MQNPYANPAFFVLMLIVVVASVYSWLENRRK